MRHPFTVEAAVSLPDHLHAISTLPADDADFARRWGLIQSAFFALFTDRRTDLRQPRQQKRARDLAAAILGAYAAGRGRFCPAPRLHPLQSGQARARGARRGLAYSSFRRWSGSAPIRPIGAATAAIAVPASAKDDGFRCAQPILRAVSKPTMTTPNPSSGPNPPAPFAPRSTDSLYLLLDPVHWTRAPIKLDLR